MFWYPFRASETGPALAGKMPALPGKNPRQMKDFILNEYPTGIIGSGEAGR